MKKPNNTLAQHNPVESQHAPYSVPSQVYEICKALLEHPAPPIRDMILSALEHAPAFKKHNDMPVTKARPTSPKAHFLQPQDVQNMFEVAREDAPHAILAMTFQFLARLREVELFGLCWDCWNGEQLYVDHLNRRPPKIITPHPILKTWLDANAPATSSVPHVRIFELSRGAYRRSLREIRKSAGIPYSGKNPLRVAGMQMLLATSPSDFELHREYTGLPWWTKKPFFSYSLHQSWRKVVDSLSLT